MRERGHEVSDETAAEIYAFKSELFNQCPEPPAIEGAYELLKQVTKSGITPVLVTGSGQASLLGRLDEAFPGIFNPDCMVTAKDVRYGKPNPEPYLMGLEKAGVLAHQAIVVENAPLGIQAGVAAGIFTIAVNTGPLPDSALLDAGANLLFPSMQSLSDAWTTLYDEIQSCTL
jgi:HAD superfamily hydrolase (TIGR01509 family)